MARTPGSKISRLQFHLIDPLKGADRLFQLAQQLVQSGEELSPDEVPEIGEAFAYLRELHHATNDRQWSEAKNRYPDLAAAHAVHTNAGVIRDEVEARLLAFESFSDITEKVQLSAGLVAKYAHYFFRLPPQGTGRDWIIDRVIKMFEWRHREPSEGDVWKYMGFVGGRHVVDILTGDFLNRPCENPRFRRVEAEKGRFLVRDSASIQRSVVPDLQWFEDSRRLFPHLHTGPTTDPEVRKFRLTIRTLEVLAHAALRQKQDEATEHSVKVRGKVATGTTQVKSPVSTGIPTSTVSCVDPRPAVQPDARSQVAS